LKRASTIKPRAGTSPVRQRFAALGLFGLPLLTFPLLSLPGGSLGGVPATYLYLFGVWVGLIALAAWVAERRRP
jgi:hypothetical protein